MRRDKYPFGTTGSCDRTIVDDSPNFYSIDRHQFITFDLSFRMRQGEVLVLVGESGCGKSTLAKILLRLLSPDSGSVTIAGRDLSSLI